MTKNGIDVSKTISEVERLLEESKDLPPALEASINMLLVVVKLLADSHGLNIRNSSKPPSTDPHREKKAPNSNKKSQGGQKGHAGNNLKFVDDPDEVEIIEIDRRSLPVGEYHECGFQSRQVFDIRINRHVIEYRAQIPEDSNGRRFIAQFPEKACKAVQYGSGVKANAVYMSMFQLIPYERIRTHFAEIFETPLSSGSFYNFNVEAYRRLEAFEQLSINKLRQEQTLNVDETGVNIDGKRKWLHTASNRNWTHIMVHAKRGKDAMDDIGILPDFKGLLVHDHWKPYYRYDNCLHALCNAHHKRELTRAYEQDGQRWAKTMEDMLCRANKATKKAGGVLPKRQCDRWRKIYRKILKEAEKECPPPKENPPGNKKRGRVSRSKSRNLLERLCKYEEDTLRFMENPLAPFTNNQGERDLRMVKVQQKISGCFRSFKGAEIYCRIHSYLSTCRKNNVGVGEALEKLFSGKWPDFIRQQIQIHAE